MIPALRSFVAVTIVVLAVLAAPATSATQPVYVMDPLGASHRHPATFTFSADGDLVGRGLRWTHWGASRTTTRGRFTLSPRPGGTPGTTLTGRLTLSRIVRCTGRRYYSHARLTFDHPEDAPFKPGITIKPC